MPNNTTIQERILSLTTKAEAARPTAMASAHGRADQMEKVIHLYEEALTLATQVAKDRTWAAININLGSAYHERLKGEKALNVEVAIQCYRSALQVISQRDFPYEYAITQCNMGNAFLDKTGSASENVAMALECYRRALQELTREKWPEDWARTIFRFGYTNCRFANRGEGIQALSELMSYAAQSGNSILRARCLQVMGFATVCSREGSTENNVEQGIPLLEEACEIYKSVGDLIELARAHFELGQAYGKRVSGDREKNVLSALRCFRQCADVLRNSEMETAIAALRLGADLALRENCFEQTGFLVGGDLELLKTLWAYAPTVMHRFNLLRSNAIIFDYLVTRALQRGQFHDALSFSLWQELTHLPTFLSNRRLVPDGTSPSQEGLYRRLVFDILASEWQLRQADIPQIVSIEVGGEELWHTSKQETGERSDTISDVRQKIEESQRRLTTLDEDLRSRFGDWVPPLTPLQLPDLVALAKANNAVVILLRVTDTGSWAFLVGDNTTHIESDNIVHAPDFSLQHHHGLIQMNWHLTYHSAVGKGMAMMGDGTFTPIFHMEGQKHEFTSRTTTFEDWLSNMDRGLRELYDRLLQRIHERIAQMKPGVRRLIFLTNKGLHLVPLHAAYYSKDGERQYLLDFFDIVNMPSASILRRCVEREHCLGGPNVFFSVADPDGDLPYSRWESRYVNGKFALGQSAILEGTRVTEDAIFLNMPSSSVALFSCHAHFDPSCPSKSSIHLANGDAFTISDVLALDLGTNWLTTLSACETALAEPFDVLDEQMGIHSAFLIAGTATAVASQWQVNDIATMLLVTKFHEFLTAPGLGQDKAHALRKAQLWLRDCCCRSN